MDLKTKAIEKIARQLANLGCEYMIVPDGDVSKALTNGRFTHHKKTKRGEYTKHIDRYAANLQPGEIVIIPVGEFPVAALQAAVSAYAFRAFGKGNFASARTEDDMGVELLCLDRDDTGEDINDLFNEEE